MEKVRKKARQLVASVLACVLVASAFCLPVAAVVDTDYVLSSSKEQIRIPKTYTVSAVYSDFGEAGRLDLARDLFIDNKDQLYIADTNNHRVLMLDRDGNLLRILTGPEDKPIKTPQGVYVDDDGDIFIADTDNSRVLHLSPEGKYVEKFTAPQSELLGEDFSFQPNKLYIDSTGNITILKRDAFFIMDANSKFLGYAGASTVSYSLWRVLVRIFGTAEQRRRVVKAQAYAYSNFLIHDDGMIYAVSADVNNNQIMKITSVGVNVYPSGVYGEFIDGKRPQFADLAVDSAGIISAVDGASGRIYQYSPDGDLLTVFGGMGNTKGTFQLPTSMAIDSEGCLYVLDGKLNNIQVFKPTSFIETVQDAVRKYNAGDYINARDSWTRVLEMDESYQLAHTGLGDAYMKEERWADALTEYELAENNVGYSKAFAEIRQSWIRDNFTLCVGIIVAVLVVVIVLFIAAKRYAEGENTRKTRK